MAVFDDKKEFRKFCLQKIKSVSPLLKEKKIKTLTKF